MNIGITQRVIDNEDYPDRRDALGHNWYSWIENALPNATLIPIPNNNKQLYNFIKSVDLSAIILSGGNSWSDDAPERDIVETDLLNWATKKKENIPILGVCRGFQVILKILCPNIKLKNTKDSDETHVDRTHSISVDKGQFSIDLPPIDKVNSYHDWGIKKNETLNQDIQVFAHTKDFIEGYYHKKYNILAIQWHPERSSPSKIFDRTLISNFLNQKTIW